jgi:hypothetical protein
MMIAAFSRSSASQRELYLRLREAMSSKMTAGQIIEGQRLALDWAPERW